MTMTQQNGPNVEAGSAVSEGFGTMAVQKTAETASSALAAQAQAAVQARFIMAMKNPRDLDEVRRKLLKECQRPNFADVARYHKPIGKGVEGPSIRFAETAMRCMGNMTAEPVITFDSPEKRTIRVTVTDLEANVTVGSDITIEKTVERSKVPSGMTPIATRTNSYGGTTYILPATEDDLLNKVNALVSKALRTNILRIVPGDIVDEAMTAVVKVQQN
ncbi:MAG: hypothetical protein M3Q61_05885, partial [Chloroflexota bacterium]|nr:hypothetical protein [Chloroflexota bacterium]